MHLAPMILALLLMIPATCGADTWGNGKGKFGDPFFRDSNAKPQLPQGAHSIGAGVGGSEILFETAHFFWQERKVGIYAGLGIPDASSTEWQSSRSYHLGLAKQFDDGWSAGAGVGVCSTISSYVSNNTYNPRYSRASLLKYSSQSVAPHGWLEYGQPRGVAARAQIGAAGFGATLQVRFGGSAKATGG